MGWSRKLKRGFLLEKEDEDLIRELARRTVTRGMPLHGVVKEYIRQTLERALDAYGDSPTQVARALSIHKTWVSRWKRGRPGV